LNKDIKKADVKPWQILLKTIQGCLSDLRIISLAAACLLKRCLKYLDPVRTFASDSSFHLLAIWIIPIQYSLHAEHIRHAYAFRKDSQQVPRPSLTKL
jgi:hypothetical protein